MTDLEITKLCAEAMRYTIAKEFTELVPLAVRDGRESGAFSYNPLHDDAQAMALVKKFRLFTSFETLGGGFWIVGDVNNDDTQTQCADLNRAICECVAKMQAAKQK